MNAAVPTTTDGAPSVVVRVLGPLEVVDRALGSRKQRRLLASLALAGGAPVSVDALVEALWGDRPPPSARNSLQSHVARLRDALGTPDAIPWRHDGYALNGSHVEVDAARFAAALSRARTSASDPAVVIDVLAPALALWRGDALAEFDDPAVTTAVAGLHRQRAEARGLLAAAQCAVGDVAGALDQLDRLAVEDPLQEDALVLRARTLAAAGRVPDGLAAIRAFRDRLADELGLDPSPAVDDVERELLQVSATARTAPLPVAPPAVAGPPRVATSTLGRDAELRRIGDALQVSSLVTLVGPGGVGKTRLAAVVAGARSRACWVDLAPLQREDDVAAAVLDALRSVAPTGTTVEDAAVAALTGFDGLVVLDNCEHVVDGVASLVEAALAFDGALRLLSTSRERLDVAGELVVTVAPLVVRPPGQTTADVPAVRLFQERLQAAGGAPVDPSTAASVVEAVAGLPLAIELAAARAATIPAAALVERLPMTLDVLEGSRRRWGDRHRTLTRVIDWSYELLDPADQQLFDRLSVFASAFTLTDAEVVCADASLRVSAIASGLARLVERSLVAAVDDGRFRLLAPLRLYAADRLERRGERTAVHARHRDAVLALADRIDRRMTGPDEQAAIDELEGALADVRAVHGRAIEAGDLTTVAQLAGRLYRAAYVQARPDLLARGAALAGDDTVAPALRWRALAAAATGAWMVGDFTRARALIAEVRLPADDPWAGFTIAESLGDMGLGEGDLPGAEAAYRDNVEMAEAAGHAGLVAQAQASLALVWHLQGRTDEAEALAREAVDAATVAGALSARVLAEYTLGDVLADRDPDQALAVLASARDAAARLRAGFLSGIVATAEVAVRGRHGDADEALAAYREALTHWQGVGGPGMAIVTLRNLVVLLARVGADAETLWLHEVVESLAQRPSYGAEARLLSRAVAASRDRLGPDVTPPRPATVPDLREAVTLAIEVVDAVVGRRRDHGIGM